MPPRGGAPSVQSRMYQKEYSLSRLRRGNIEVLPIVRLPWKCVVTISKCKQTRANLSRSALVAPARSLPLRIAPAGRGASAASRRQPDLQHRAGRWCRVLTIAFAIFHHLPDFQHLPHFAGERISFQSPDSEGDLEHDIDYLNLLLKASRMSLVAPLRCCHHGGENDGDDRP